MRADRLPRHRKPRDNSPSRFVATHAAEIAWNAPGPVLDVACEYGRNALCLTGHGAHVVCLDNDPAALRYIQSEGQLPANASIAGCLTTIKIDLQPDSWPYPLNTVGAIISIDFTFQQLLKCFVASLKSGGYLLLETIGGHGGNYLSLPEPGFIKDVLADAVDFRYFKETQVGPSDSRRATAKLLAVKRNNP